MNHPKRKSVLNIWVDHLTKDEALNQVKTYLSSGKRPHSIFASNPEKNFSVPKDTDLYRIYKNADILLPDGIGMVLALRILYGIRVQRIPGSELIFDICDLARRMGKSIFIYGAKENVNLLAAEKLKKRFPGLIIAGRSNGYVTEKDMKGLIDKINESKADILFLALGSPMQEKWFEKYSEQLDHVKVCQGIGGTLDTIAGTVKRAPENWCRMNLEWLYRLLKEPKRISRQKVLPLFARDVIKTWIMERI